jgi:type IV secretion system protein VirD4
LKKPPNIVNDTARLVFYGIQLHMTKTHRYNPLSIINQNKVLRIDQIQKIAHIFIPDNPKQDPIWTVQPRVLFVALILFLLDTPERPCTLGEMVRIVKDTADFSNWVNETIESRTDLDPLCYRNAHSFLQTHHKTQSSILQSFLSYFELWDNPLIDAATSHSDFDITQLRKERMTIYVGVTSDNLVRLTPLITVFYQQILDNLLQKIPDLASEPYGLLLLLDEFNALGKMEILQKNIFLKEN